eukprot:TRINITY_DN4104_c0_g1_i1.p1 TRINITY_DN4104_c0_g1~~TRINITY_DN4104_c0_g1_i1.p1  ORF type:complete len:381 (+),score=102.77 TRINITY_DN4104_c0_g1_i1:108-1250(+)
MKVSIKTLEGKTFEVDIADSDTVDTLKQRIETEQGIAIDTQKLIHKGKVMQVGANTVVSYGVKEGDFLVIMVSKPKAAPVQPAPVQPAPVQPAPQPVAQPAQPAAQPAAATGVADTFSTGPELESAISQICEMGFERTQVQRAMRMAYNNPDRAVDLLMSGVPLPEEAPASQQQQAAAQPQQGGAPSAGSAQSLRGMLGSPEELSQIGNILAQGPSGLSSLSATQVQQLHGLVQLHLAAQQQAQERAQRGGGGGGGQLAGPLAALRQHPMFQQMRQLIRSNPQAMQQLLGQLAQTNPQLVQAIQANPDQFLQLLGDDDAGGPPPGTIQVSPEERDAIERLCTLGFDRNLVIQAYFACEKNEELAANYLFEHGHDDDMSDD